MLKFKLFLRHLFIFVNLLALVCATEIRFLCNDSIGEPRCVKLSQDFIKKYFSAADGYSKHTNDTSRVSFDDCKFCEIGNIQICIHSI